MPKQQHATRTKLIAHVRASAQAQPEDIKLTLFTLPISSWRLSSESWCEYNRTAFIFWPSSRPPLSLHLVRASLTEISIRGDVFSLGVAAGSSLQRGERRESCARVQPPHQRPSCGAEREVCSLLALQG